MMEIVRTGLSRRLWCASRARADHPRNVEAGSPLPIVTFSIAHDERLDLAWNVLRCSISRVYPYA
jgi:hypothetical protein